MGRRQSINAVEGFNHSGTPIPVASRIDNIVYTGGISGYDLEKKGFVEGPEAQAELTFIYLRRIIEAAGGTVGDIIRVTFLVSGLEVKKQINKEWEAMFPDPDDRPARQVIVQQMKPGKFMVCDAVAVLEK